MKRDGKRRSPGKTGVKVVYISNPMKVKASASEFRAVVQELTGRDSDVARFMDGAPDADHHHRHPAENTSYPGTAHGERHRPSAGTVGCGSGNVFTGEYGSYSLGSESPTESESFVERFDGNLFSMPHVERRFRDNSFPFVFQESALLDVLN